MPLYRRIGAFTLAAGTCVYSSCPGFWKALVDVQFQDPTKKMPYVRNALLLANLTCPQAKIEDGVAKLLKPGDVGSWGQIHEGKG